MQSWTELIAKYKQQALVAAVIVGVLLLLIGVTKCSGDETVTAEEQAEEQIEETNMALFHQRQGDLTAAIDRAIAANALDFFALMVTDPVRGNSELLFRGLESVRRALPYRKGPDGTLMMPGVLSRKKQLLPEVIAALT